MADSIIDIWNMALSNIGSTQQVQTPTDTTKSATVCALWWPRARDRVIRAMPWQWATLTTLLAQIPATVYAPVDWAYAYTYPADCLKGLEIVSGMGRRPSPKARIAWAIRGLAVNTAGGQVTGAQKMVVTDLAPVAAGTPATNASSGNWCEGGIYVNTAMPSPTFRYLSRIADPTVYPPDVDIAMAWSLASLIAMPMAMTKELKQTADNMMGAAIKEAFATGFNEQQMDAPIDAGPELARG